MNVRFLPSGDTALVVEFGQHIDRGLSEQVLRLDARVKKAIVLGVVETVPTFRSLLVHYDPLQTSADALRRRLGELLETDDERDSSARTWKIPVCYEAEHAPDMDWVMKRTGLTRAGVIARHCSVRYHAYMVGFLPGYPYLGDLPDDLVLPRREDPRLRVRPGSVGIASSLTAIYPVQSPAGWHLIGRTPLRVFRPDASPPALIAPGDRILFTSIASADYDAIRAEDEHGGRFPSPVTDVS